MKQRPLPPVPDLPPFHWRDVPRAVECNADPEPDLHKHATWCGFGLCVEGWHKNETYVWTCRLQNPDPHENGERPTVFDAWGTATTPGDAFQRAQCATVGLFSALYMEEKTGRWIEN